MSSADRSTIEQMLKDVTEVVRKEYYDPTFGGLDLEAAYRTAQQNIAKATSVRQGYEAIADVLRQLNDSHTYFIPPQQPFVIDPGWEMQLIGEKGFVTRVKPGSDAQTKGLKQGDQVLMIDGVKPARENWENLKYELIMLSPRSSLHLVVMSPGEQPRSMVTNSVVKPRRAEYDLTTNDTWYLYHQEQADNEKYEPRTQVVGDVLIWKLPRFLLKDEAVDAEFRKADKYKALIIDLRGNPGGLISTMTRVTQNVFDRDVQVAEAVGREKSKPITAKGGSHSFQGKLIVLVDSNSASGSELFARVVQLEKRGTVIGDRTAGEVRDAHRKAIIHSNTMYHQYAYGVEVTFADLKMGDGKSLEKVGVVPDEILLPSPEELAASADPQLARALQMAGVMMSAQKAGTLFPPLDH